MFVSPVMFNVMKSGYMLLTETGVTDRVTTSASNIAIVIMTRRNTVIF